MTNAQTHTATAGTGAVATTPRAEALARVLEQGIENLITFAGTLTDAQWKTPIPKDGRTVGVVVHHVASVLPIEIELAQALAKGAPITGVTWDVIHEMNANHATQHANVTKTEAIQALRTNAAAAAAAIRELRDAELDSAATISLYADAPLTCQFMLEDHAVRHSYHHLAKIKGAVNA
jgi:hypothetical protein